MSYTYFSQYYDKLMSEDFDYEKIADYIENVFDMFDCRADIVCELACGTGNITLPLARRGYDMIAIDRSFQMLDIARKKAAEQGADNILFLNQNMTRLDLYGSANAFICMIDGINYILNPNSLFNMFKKIRRCFIEPDGLILFDISTEYKLKNKLGNNTFIYNGDDMFYSWENRYLENKKISDMYLNFFAKQKNGLYRRFAERHLQRAYNKTEILEMLRKAGFEKTEVFDGFSFAPCKDSSERAVFAARIK